MSPTISVIIPAFNTSLYVSAAIESALNQSLPPSQVIVVDDGSQDNTAEVASSFGERVCVFRRPHSGIGASRNFGVSRATGELLAFLDSDDLWTPDKLKVQVLALERDPHLHGIFGLVRQFYTPGLEVPEEQVRRLNAAVETGYIAGSMLIRRELFESVGAFDESLKVGEFLDWFARAKDNRLKLAVLPEVTLLRRIHRTNTGIVQASARGDYVTVMKAILDRRRTSAAAAATAQDERITN